MNKENSLISEYKKYIVNLYDNYDLSMALIILHSYFSKRLGKDIGDISDISDISASIIDVFTWFNNLFPTKTFGICEIKKLISNKKNIYKYIKHCKNVGATSKEINDYIDKLIEHSNICLNNTIDEINTKT